MFGRLLSFWRKEKAFDAQQEGTGSTIEEDDRRVWTRHEASSRTFVTWLGGERERIEATVREVSRGGLKVILDRHIQPGEMLQVEIPVGDSEHSASSVLACIIHAQELDDQQWAFGCAFSNELSGDELAAFGAATGDRLQLDQRNQDRIVCDMQASFALTEDEVTSPATSWDAQVVNISLGGVGLLVSDPIESGRLLNVTLRSTTRDVERSLLACVVHVTAHPDGAFTLGCNFIRELEEKDLKALL